MPVVLTAKTNSIMAYPAREPGQYKQYEMHLAGPQTMEAFESTYCRLAFFFLNEYLRDEQASERYPVHCNSWGSMCQMLDKLFVNLKKVIHRRLDAEVASGLGVPPTPFPFRHQRLSVLLVRDLSHGGLCFFVVGSPSLQIYQSERTWLCRYPRLTR